MGIDSELRASQTPPTPDGLKNTNPSGLVVLEVKMSCKDEARSAPTFVSYTVIESKGIPASLNELGKMSRLMSADGNSSGLFRFNLLSVKNSPRLVEVY